VSATLEQLRLALMYVTRIELTIRPDVDHPVETIDG